MVSLTSRLSQTFGIFTDVLDRTIADLNMSNFRSIYLVFRGRNLNFIKPQSDNNQGSVPIQPFPAILVPDIPL